MAQSVKDLIGRTLVGPDGEIGKVADLYFDDYAWSVRYLVVETGSWLDSRRVMLTPGVIEPGGTGGADEKDVRVSVTCAMIEKSPEVGTELPLSREHLALLHTYFEWPFYWEGGALMNYPLIELASEVKESQRSEGQTDSHLRSARDVIGYNIRARDGDVGHLEDMIYQPADYQILYLVIDTGGWLPGRQVLIAPQWASQIDWGGGDVVVDLERATVKNSPEYDPSVPIGREYEEHLYDYYKRPKYWEK